MKKPDISKPAFKLLPKAKENVLNNKCAACGGEVNEFRDEESRNEYKISGMCQKCQDTVF